MRKGFETVTGQRDLLRLATAAALALVVVGQALAAPPAPFKEEKIGGAAAGSTTVNTDGSWTVTAAGNQYDGNTSDQLYFVYQAIKGNGAIMIRYPGPEAPNQYVGVMVRKSLDPDSAMATVTLSTSRVNWIHRNNQGDSAARDDGDNTIPLFTEGTNLYPKNMMIQRVGNTVEGYASEDGKLWRLVKTVSGAGIAVQSLELDETAPIGVSVSFRGSGTQTIKLDAVSLLSGVTTVKVTGSAAIDKAALVTWEPIAGAEGYLVYRGPADSSKLSQLTALSASPIKDPGFLDTVSSGTVKDLAYVVTAVFKDSTGKLFEGPGIRVR